MGDYRFLVAVMSETCAMCNGPVVQGKPMYYEAESRKRLCRKCGRAVKIHGEEKALMLRLLGHDVDHLFKED